MQAVARFGLRLPFVLTKTSPKATRSLLRTMATANSYHMLQYSYVSDILEKRGPHREAHIAGAKKMADSNKLVMAGALTEPVDGAVFIFRNVTAEEIEGFVKADPYVQNGLVPKYSIRPYMVVAGDCS